LPVAGYQLLVASVYQCNIPLIWQLQPATGICLPNRQLITGICPLNWQLIILAEPVTGNWKPATDNPLRP
jgi:hypothetical protein